VTVLETIALFGLVPLAIYLIIAGAIALPKLARRPKYKVGEPWNYAPLWWTANPQGAPAPAMASERVGENGGARGSW
jgi:hypothetical protein